MKTNPKIWFIALSTLVAGLILGWLISGGPESNHEKHDPISTDEITIWTCSMHPQIRSEEPGDCPICGMDLIPLEENKSALNADEIKMSPTAMQLAGVSTALVGTMQPEKVIHLNGKVQPDERLVFSQTSHLSGRVEELKVNITGEYIEAGEPIATIYSPDLATAQEELLQAFNIRQEQPRLFEAAKEKLKNWKLSENQINRIIQSGSVNEVFTILADRPGYVIERLVNTGDYVNRGAAIYKIADLTEVWILLDVYENDLPWVKKGDQVHFTVASLPGKEFTGEISFIDPVIDSKTRVANARVEVKNEKQRLKPEMFVSAELTTSLSGMTNEIVIPKSAVLWTGKRSVVYVKSGKGSFSMREVVLGPSLGDAYVIESGLKSGEEIVVNGTFSIDAAAQLAGKSSMMSPEKEETPPQSLNEQIKTEQHIRFSLSAEARKQIRPMIQDYLRIKNALAEDDPTTAKKAAENLRMILKNINAEQFPSKSQEEWMSSRVSLERSVTEFLKSSSISDTRNAFMHLSEEMIRMIKNFNPTDEELYIQYCPMANDNQGASWISQSREIKNPYFGTSMLHCGEVTEEI